MLIRHVLAAVAVLSLGACGADDDASDAHTSDDTAHVTTGESVETSAAATAPADGEATITIADFAFAGVSEVSVGTTVVVTNTDDVQHTWTAVDGPFDSGALGPGDSFEFTFVEPGEFDYVCSFHPSMTGTIAVTG